MKKRNIFGVIASTIILSMSFFVSCNAYDSGNQIISGSFHWTGDEDSNIASGSNSISDKKYGEGMYKIGVDMPSGEYIVFCNSDLQGYFCVSSDSNQNDIIQNENFEYNSIITVNDGEYFNLNRCYAISSSENPEVKTDGTGMFEVGKHIPAGEYKLIGTSDVQGYYCIYDSSRQNNIVANQNFSNSTYVTVSDGQYLLLNRCRFENAPEKPEMIFTDKETIQDVQEKLNSRGYDCGIADGLAGEKTKNAIISFKHDNNLGTDASITQELLDCLNTTTQSSDNEKTEMDIDQVMATLATLPQYATITISEPVIEDGEIGYSILYNSRNYGILINPFNKGKTTLGVIPTKLEGEDEVKDYIDFLAYFVQAVDGSVSAFDAYTVVINTINNGTCTNNGIEYTYLSGSASFYVES